MVGCAMRTKMPAGRYLHGAHGAPYFDNTLNLLALRLTLFVAEGEDYFLAFLPADKRQAIRDDWYQGIRKSNRDDEGAISWLSKEFVTGYKLTTLNLSCTSNLNGILVR